MTDEQARELNDRIFENDKSDKWLHHVITERANIELMLIDPYWARFKFERAYKFAVPVLNVTTMVDGYHASSFASQLDSPYRVRQQQGQRDQDARRLPGDARCDLSEGRRVRRRLPEDDARLPADARLSERPARAGRAGLRPTESRAVARGNQGLSGLHHVAAVRAVGQARAAVSDSHRPGPDSGLEPDAAGRSDRRQPADEVRAVPRRLSLGRRDGRDRHAAQKRLGRFGLAAAALATRWPSGPIRNGWK